MGHNKDVITNILLKISIELQLHAHICVKNISTFLMLKLCAVTCFLIKCINKIKRIVICASVNKVTQLKVCDSKQNTETQRKKTTLHPNEMERKTYGKKTYTERLKHKVCCVRRSQSLSPSCQWASFSRTPAPQTCKECHRVDGNACLCPCSSPIESHRIGEKRKTDREKSISHNKWKIAFCPKQAQHLITSSESRMTSFQMRFEASYLPPPHPRFPILPFS